ncbi:MAG TPA: hypothetical protein ENN34_08670 [Deltaproteobacteria bacterium]|nr:hypothetical protein [Deltaproteobacteria bacterium]
MKDKKSLNTPFSKLRGIKIPEKPPPQAPKKKVGERGREPQVMLDDRALFVKAMEGVTPMESDTVIPNPLDQRVVIDQVQENRRKQDLEVRNTLDALVKGTARFDITSTGEYVEGHVVSLDLKTMKKLKDGEFTIQTHLDLHGYVKDDAQRVLTNFIQNAHALENRSLLIIHGRGLKSDQGPVLKEHVIRWLTRGTLSHLVLAFCSARPCDGGTGAIYVLLKKHPRKSPWKRPL